MQRRIDRLLDKAEEAADQRDWTRVRDLCDQLLRLDPENEDALTFLDAAGRDPGVLSPESALAPQPAPSEADAMPQSFAGGRYDVKEFLGEGGKKRVYLAHDTTLDRDVAFALIKSESLDADSARRVTREAQAMGRLGEHPQIMPIYDLGTEDGRPYMVLPIMPGGDVQGLIEDAPDHRLPLEQAAEVARSVCRGLEFAHSKGIVHRDLKPGNVWLTADPSTWLRTGRLRASCRQDRRLRPGAAA